MIYPLNLPFTVSQRWGENPQYYGTIGMKGHNGWDFAVPTGTKVFATHEGEVTFAEIDSSMSLTVTITGSEYQTLYCHLSELRVTKGQKVKAGDCIALSGNTGRYTTGPHLHFGVKPLSPDYGNGYNGAIDPAPLFDGGYPTPASKPADTPFLAMQRAIKNFQVSQGITTFANEDDLRKIRFGPKTLETAKKFYY